MNKFDNKKLLIYYLFNRYIILFINVLIFSFISIIKTSYTSEIHLTIEGNGLQQILNETFNREPNDVIVNNENRNDCKKFCDLTSYTNDIILKFNSIITSCDDMFYGSNNITQIDLSNFNTAQVTSMQYMFKGCTNLRNINFGNIDTSKVTNMEGFFRDCIYLISIDLSYFDTSSLENAKEMFSSCSSLISLNLSNFNPLNSLIIFIFDIKKLRHQN